MQKNKEISHAKIYTIAISTIFLASFMLSGSQFTQQAIAIHEGNSTTAPTQNQLTGGNTTTTGPSALNQTGFDGNTTTTDTSTQNQATAGGNASDAGATSTPTPTAATQEPPVNQNFVRQGTVASGISVLQSAEEGDENVAFILPPRNDGSVYSGVLTYTASKPVGVLVLHNYDPQNSTAIPEDYGTELTAELPDGSGNVAMTLFQPAYTGGINAASVPFTGNGLALHTLEEGPFTATYTVNAFATQPEDANAPLEFITAEGEVDASADEEAADDASADDASADDSEENP
ncbi:hypothetical protein BH18THE2_BH18THE2_05400 [soil metagenome]